MGWRYTLLCLGAICLVIFFLRFVVFRFQESPKFLIYRGRDDKAVMVLQKIAKFNGRESSITLESFEALANEHASTANRGPDLSTIDTGTKTTKTWTEQVKTELKRCRILFSTFSIARLTVLVWITYIFDYWGFSIAGESAAMSFNLCRPCHYTNEACRVFLANYSTSEKQCN